MTKIGTRNLDLTNRLQEVCGQAVRRGEVPGGVVWIGCRDETVVAFPFGMRATVPNREPATLDTIYDLASLTKPLVTAMLTMQAVEEGRLNLYEPLGSLLPISSENPVSQTTPRELLLHISGLPAGREVPASIGSSEDIVADDGFVAAMVDGGLVTEPGIAFVYSDVGFHLLAAVIRRALGAPLRDLAQERIYEPLGTSDLAYGVPDDARARTAPTEMCEGVMLRGVVHDPPARRLGGVCGHAGLFGTAADISRFCRMILRRGEIDGNRLMQPATVDRMIAPVDVPDGKRRALGWDVDTQYSNPRGEILPSRGVGHTGYTGPSLWIDPPSGIYIILLTNRVHPDGRGDAVRLRRLLANVVAVALLP